MVVDEAQSEQETRTPKPSVLAPAISFGLSGFVLGVLITLLAVGVFNSSGGAVTPPATLPPDTPVADYQMTQQVRRIVRTVLGPAYPGPRTNRLLKNPILTPVVPSSVIAPPLPADLARYRNVEVTFLLNDHPLGKSWRLKAAKADVFAVMKALYTSQLPIYNVELDGYYPMGRPKHTHLQRVLVAYVDHNSASRVPWKRWGRADENRLWQLLPYRLVNSNFG